MAGRVSKAGKGGPRDLYSPGRGRPVQLRFETSLTAGDYVSRKAWTKASLPDCLRGRPGCDCRLLKHGTYQRKTPVPMHVARFDCRECRTTISCLPDFAAARHPGALQEIEERLVALAGTRSFWAAARAHHPDRDEMSNAIRSLRGLLAAVSAFLAAAVTLRHQLFRGCPPQLVAMRAALGTDTLLVDLRREMTGQLQLLPPPVGFRPPGRGGKSPTGPPTHCEPCFGTAGRAT